eukprot:scaffold232314_cov32-Tisochrysis_lutea.AAC.3
MVHFREVVIRLRIHAIPGANGRLAFRARESANGTAAWLIVIKVCRPRITSRKVAQELIWIRRASHRPEECGRLADEHPRE